MEDKQLTQDCNPKSQNSSTKKPVEIKELVQPSWYGTRKYWDAVKSRDKNLTSSTSMGL